LKKRDLSPWFHETAALLGLKLDDQDRRAPNYPGREEGRRRRRVCIARLKKPEHLAHEFAHFVSAVPRRRDAPNYGLGTDPDGGPETSYHNDLGLETAVLAWQMSEDLAKRIADELELLASFLTFPLLVDAGLPWRRSDAAKAWCDPATPELEEDQRARLERCIAHFSRRNISIYDPLAHFRAGDPNR